MADKSGKRCIKKGGKKIYVLSSIKRKSKATTIFGTLKLGGKAALLCLTVSPYLLKFFSFVTFVISPEVRERAG